MPYSRMLGVEGAATTFPMREGARGAWHWAQGSGSQAWPLLCVLRCPHGSCCLQCGPDWAQMVPDWVPCASALSLVQTLDRAVVTAQAGPPLGHTLLSPPPTPDHKPNSGPGPSQYGPRPPAESPRGRCQRRSHLPGGSVSLDAVLSCSWRAEPAIIALCSVPTGD